jgi:5'-3' exonuclease
MIQLDFFAQDETELLRLEIDKVSKMGEKTRKSLFAKHGELAKYYADLDRRLAILEYNICKTKNLGEQ